MEASQPKPLSIGKLALGVCAGILLAVGILGTIYYFSVVRPQQAALRQAQFEAKIAIQR